MVLGRATQRDQRRRRALVDGGSLKTSSSKTRQSKDQSANRSYAAAALEAEQPRISSFIPARPWTYSLWVLGLATVLTLHATLAGFDYEVRMNRLPIDLSSLSLNQTPSLYVFTGGFALILAGAYAALVLRFRRHKTDDYRGRYRLWYPAILGLCAFGVVSASGFSTAVSSTANWISQLPKTPIQPSWWAVLIGVLAGAVFLRMLIEIRTSRAAVITWIGATTCFIMAWIVGQHWIPFPTDQLREPAESLLWLGGCLLTLMTTISYSRYVFLDAQGSVVRRQATKSSSQPPAVKLKRQKGIARQTKPTTPEISQPESTTPTKLKVASLEDSKTEVPTTESDAEAGRSLSRSERKRLRKQKRRQKKAA